MTANPTTLALPALQSTQTEADFLATALEIATAAGLPVTSWRDGDPTITNLRFLAQVLAAAEPTAAEYARGGYLSTSEGEWTKVHAIEVYGVDPAEATQAAPTATLTNAGGGLYVLEAGGLILRASSTGKTFRNTDPLTIAPLASVVVALLAEEAGSASSVVADEVDQILAPALLGVVVASSTAATGVEEQATESLKTECLDSLGPLSPMGPRDAYSAIARRADLTGRPEVTRARSVGSGVTGAVTLWIATSAGAASPAAVTAVQEAIIQWAMPLCSTPTTVSAVPQAVTVTATIAGANLATGWAAAAEAAIVAHLSALPIGGLVARSAIIAIIDRAARAPSTTGLTIALSAPAADLVLLEAEVPVPGPIALTVAP